MNKTSKILIMINIFIFAIIVFIAFLYYGSLFVIHDFNPDFLAIDSCLDNGEKWDYENKKPIKNITDNK